MGRPHRHHPRPATAPRPPRTERVFRAWLFRPWAGHGRTGRPNSRRGLPRQGRKAEDIRGLAAPALPRRGAAHPPSRLGNALLSVARPSLGKGSPKAVNSGILDVRTTFSLRVMDRLPEPAARSSESDALRRLIDLGIALSAERNHDRLLEQILLGAKELTNADGGTLYLRTDDNRLAFEILRNDTLKVAMGGTTGKPITFPPLKLYRDDGTPNHNNVATYVALSAQTINIVDAYDTANFDFSGTKAFDEKTGYRSKSFLTLPLKNPENEVVGVIQLINARVPGEATVIPFSESIVPLVEALASQAAMALENQRLIQDQRNLFDAFIKMMASAVDAKSPYT